jgi:hypothetical protein
MAKKVSSFPDFTAYWDRMLKGVRNNQENLPDLSGLVGPLDALLEEARELEADKAEARALLSQAAKRTRTRRPGRGRPSAGRAEGPLRRPQRGAGSVRHRAPASAPCPQAGRSGAPEPADSGSLMTYVGLLYQRLMSSRSRQSWKKLPLVIPVVVYNGAEPWDVATDLGSLIGELDPSAEIYRPQLRYLLVDEAKYPPEELAVLDNPVAELFRIEMSRDGWEIRASVQRLWQRIPPDEAALREAFETWLVKVVLPRLSGEQGFGALTLEEIDTMLLENIDRWNRELREEGRQEAAAQMLFRLLRLKFGSLTPEIEERVRSTDADRLLEWGERVLSAERLQDVFGD